MNFATFSAFHRHPLNRLAAVSLLTLLIAACGGGESGGAAIDGTTDDLPPAAPPVTTALPDTRSTASGWRHTVFLKSDGTVWTIGENADG